MSHKTNIVILIAQQRHSVPKAECFPQDQSLVLEAGQMLVSGEGDEVGHFREADSANFDWWNSKSKTIDFASRQSELNSSQENGRIRSHNGVHLRQTFNLSRKS
jgi:hypothetical protein